MNQSAVSTIVTIDPSGIVPPWTHAPPQLADSTTSCQPGRDCVRSKSRCKYATRALPTVCFSIRERIIRLKTFQMVSKLWYGPCTSSEVLVKFTGLGRNLAMSLTVRPGSYQDHINHHIAMIPKDMGNL
jgi:hypothetical protein